MPDPKITRLNNIMESALPHLLKNLRAQHALQLRMEVCIKSKRQAISESRIDSVAGICEEENDLLQQLGDLEKARLVMVGSLTQAIEPDAQEPLSIKSLAGYLNESQARELLDMREILLEQVKKVRQESSVVRDAMESLNHHMIGILQTVRSALSGAGVYEQKGRVAMGAQLEFSVDVRS
ncbi:MAG: flagellar export chaperone FlgN [Planctomycetota bacterium]|nr:flagellar export chaperone FlgN [Planctomycetota bacterium]